MITLLYELCQRVVDVRKLQWSNIDLDTDCFEFTQEKTGTRMSIPISPSIRKRLELHSISNNDNFILREESTGKPYTQDRAVKSFRRLAKDYGLPEVPIAGHRNEDGSQKYTSIWLNDLRRTGTTHASRAGCTDRELMALTGHKNPSMLVVYAKQGNIEAANAMKKRGIL
jgi:integrase